MAADSQTFMMAQLLIASVALLFISWAYIWFLKNKMKKSKPSKPHIFEYAYDGSRAGKKVDTDQPEVDVLGELSAEQFYLSSRIKEISSEKEVDALSEDERDQLLKHIEALETSLEESGKKLTSVKLQHKQTNQDLKNEENKVSNLKKAVESGGSNQVIDKDLAEKNKQLRDELEEKDHEIRKLRVNSSLMTKELDDLKLDNFDAYELKKSLEEMEQKLQRSEAERELLENNFVELAESQGSRSTKELEEEIARMKKEYEMLEQRFIGSGAA